MARLIVTSVQPQTVTTSFTPLNSTFRLVEQGGSLSQFYYTNANVYIPNRATTPMMLAPKLYVIDPDQVISNGDKSSQLTVQWFENNAVISTNSNYTVNADGTLTVMKNVLPSAPVTISCKATFTDTRNGVQIIFEDSVILKSYSKSDENVTISLDKDVACLYNPIKDSKTIEINASLKLGANDVPTANAAYWWYIVTGNTEALITETDAAYVSGQGTAKLTLNAEMIDKLQVKVKGAYYDGVKPSSPVDTKIAAGTTVKWSMPGTVSARVESPNGEALRANMSSMTFKVIIYDNTQEITNAASLFSVRWYRKSTGAGGKAIEVGSGLSVTIPAAELRGSNGVHMEVWPEIADLGCFYEATDGNNDFTDENNNDLIIR